MGGIPGKTIVYCHPALANAITVLTSPPNVVPLWLLIIEGANDMRGKQILKSTEIGLRALKGHMAHTLAR